MAMLRAEKTSKNRDDVKVLVVGVFIAVALMVGPYYLDLFGQHRCPPEQSEQKAKP